MPIPNWISLEFERAFWTSLAVATMSCAICLRNELADLRPSSSNIRFSKRVRFSWIKLILLPG
jgi:hypothetical protein